MRSVDDGQTYSVGLTDREALWLIERAGGSVEVNDETIREELRIAARLLEHATAREAAQRRGE